MMNKKFCWVHGKISSKAGTLGEFRAVVHGATKFKPHLFTKVEFVNLLRSPGIDFQPSVIKSLELILVAGHRSRYTQ